MRRTITHTVFRPWWRLSRGLTLGVRGMVTAGGKVMLVRHSYLPGWYLPGGGVERGETVTEALERELREETNVEVTAPPRLIGVFSNEDEHSGDHVVLFLVEAWRQERMPKGGIEIAEVGLFPIDGLPQGTTPATRRRIAELFEGAEPGAHW